MVSYTCRTLNPLYGTETNSVVLTPPARRHSNLGVISSNSIGGVETTMEEASQQLASLHQQIEKISEKIAESHNDVAVQLRELISVMMHTMALVVFRYATPLTKQQPPGARYPPRRPVLLLAPF